MKIPEDKKKEMDELVEASYALMQHAFPNLCIKVRPEILLNYLRRENQDMFEVLAKRAKRYKDLSIDEARMHIAATYIGAPRSIETLHIDASVFEEILTGQTKSSKVKKKFGHHLSECDACKQLYDDCK